MTTEGTWFTRFLKTIQRDSDIPLLCLAHYIASHLKKYECFEDTSTGNKRMAFKTLEDNNEANSEEEANETTRTHSATSERRINNHTLRILGI